MMNFKESEMVYVPVKHTKWISRIFWATAIVIGILVLDTLMNMYALYSIMK